MLFIILIISIISTSLHTNSSWGHGLTCERQKTEHLMAGGNQQSYSFKNALIEHIGCSSIRSGGQEHFKAKQHAMKERYRQEIWMSTPIWSALEYKCAK